MITGFFLSLVLAFASFFVGLLPTIAFPTPLGDAIVLFWGYLNLFSMVIPVATILQILVLYFSYIGFYLLWQAFHWVLRRIRR